MEIPQRFNIMSNKNLLEVSVIRWKSKILSNCATWKHIFHHTCFRVMLRVESGSNTRISSYMKSNLPTAEWQSRKNVGSMVQHGKSTTYRKEQSDCNQHFQVLTRYRQGSKLVQGKFIRSWAASASLIIPSQVIGQNFLQKRWIERDQTRNSQTNDC